MLASLNSNLSFFLLQPTICFIIVCVSNEHRGHKSEMLINPMFTYLIAKIKQPLKCSIFMGQSYLYYILYL